MAASTVPGNGDETTDETARPGFSRRGFLGAGAGGVASAVVLGSGISPAAANPNGSGPGPRGPMREADPHDAVARHSTAPTFGADAGTAVRILPINRATFRPGATFDLRVEAVGVDQASTEIRIDVRDQRGPVSILIGEPVRTSAAAGSVEVTYVGLSYPTVGDFTVTASVKSSAGANGAVVTHSVVAQKTAGRPAKNVIFFLGDGMGGPAITAARILSKGMTEGRYNGMLEMDQMDFRGLVTTSGVDSIATDSANSMSAYMTGHKSSVNAMGVYVGNAADPNAHPKVETVTEILKRSRNMAIGVVTTAEIQDATPAAVWAHTRRRGEYQAIMDQALTDGQMPDVLLGGGRASLLPKGTAGSRRTDTRNLITEFQAEGFAYASTRTELKDVVEDRPDKLLGLFHTGNMNVYIDREITKANSSAFPDQPTLMEMTEAALGVLSQRDEGFFLVVEAASIDKMEHPLDGPRAVYDCIELDQAVGIAKRFAEENGDTLIVVTADHNHSMSIVGTHDARSTVTPDRQANGVYAEAGFPTYSDSNGNGFPDNPSPDIQLFFGWSNHPDHRDDFQHNPQFVSPSQVDATGAAFPNPSRDPGAVVQVGNLPSDQTSCVHTVEDVYVIASGPGSAAFNGVLDNTDIFHRMMDALHLNIPVAPRARGRRD